jgi:excisionase family DNA binding protein
MNRAETERLLSPHEAAELLGLHVRTIRRYIRDGRLDAVRVGNRYRISRASLEALIDGPLETGLADPSRNRPHTEVSSVVDLQPIDDDDAQRLTTLVLGAAGTGGGDRPKLGVQLIHEPERDRLRVISTGSIADTAALLALVTAFQQS